MREKKVSKGRAAFNFTVLVLGALTVMTLWVEPAFAQLPWEAPLEILTTSISGPVATGVAIIAFFIAGAILVFGQDMSGFGRSVVLIILAVSFLKLGADFITALFG